MMENLDTDRLMSGSLGNWLAHQTVERDRAARKSIQRFLVSFGVLVPLAIVLALLGFLQFGFSGFFFLAACIGAGIWAYYPRAEAIKKVKIGINEAIADAVGITYSLKGDGGAAYERCKKHKMLPSHNKQAFEDFWQGEVAGRPFQLFEAHLENETSDSDGGTKTVTKFRGPFLSVGFARQFHGTTLIQRAGTHKKFGFFGGKKDSISAAGKTMDAVDIVHPEFEDAFDVYATDQVEARYLVHPAYVERMLEVEQAFQGKELRAIFCGGELTIVVEASNMFESGGMDASKDRDKVDLTISQFRALANLAQSLNESER